MDIRYGATAVALLFLILLAGCSSPGKDIPHVEKTPAAAATKPAYSPYVVKVDGTPHFQTISFKDVGVGLDASSSEPLYETLADSLAHELSTQASFEAQLDHQPQFADPSHHVACGSRHVYVDVWRSSNPDRWGYSLWSGCDEESKFKWEEVESSFSPDEDLVEQVEPVSRAIATSLRHAHKSGCFTSEC